MHELKELLKKEVIDTQMIKKILQYYWINYVKDAVLHKEKSCIYLYSNLGINAPWYCDSTGHLNAVELNLAFNQMMYLAIGKCIELGWIEALQDYDMYYFMNKYWQDFLITYIHSEFRSPLNSSSFCGVLRINNIRKFAGNIRLELDLTTTNNHNLFPQPGIASHSYSKMTVIIKAYKQLI